MAEKVNKRKESPSDIWRELFGWSNLEVKDIDDTHCKVTASDGSSFIFEVGELK